jgi:uncharacterized protein YbcI
VSEKTKGQMEDDISKAIVKFEKEHLGRGPQEVKTYIVDDMVFVRLKGMLTPGERQLARTSEGRNLTKQMRMQLLETSRDILDMIIYEATGRRNISLHSDISTKTGERIMVFTLDRPIMF